jgi:hypothetical protein
VADVSRHPFVLDTTSLDLESRSLLRYIFDVSQLDHLRSILCDDKLFSCPYIDICSHFCILIFGSHQSILCDDDRFSCLYRDICCHSAFSQVRLHQSMMNHFRVHMDRSYAPILHSQSRSMKCVLMLTILLSSRPDHHSISQVQIKIN